MRLASTAPSRLEMAAACLLAVAPILRGGRSTDLWAWKGCAIAILLLATAFRPSPLDRSCIAHRIKFLIALCTVQLLVSHLWNDHKGIGRHLLEPWLAAVLFFFLATRLFGRRFLRFAVVAILVSVSAVALLAILQLAVIRLRVPNPWLHRLLPPEMTTYFFELGKGVGPAGVRLTSTFFHSNQLGHFLAVAWGFLLPLGLAARGWRRRTVYGTVLLQVILGCVLSQSRGALLVIGVETVLVLALNRPRLSLRRLTRWALLAAVLAAGALVLTGNFSAFARRIGSDGLTLRDRTWSYSLQVLPQVPIFGVGPGCSAPLLMKNFGILTPEDLFLPYYAGSKYTVHVLNPHNQFLCTLIEAGPLSLATSCLLLVTLASFGLRAVRERKRRTLRLLATAAFTPLCGELVRSLFESYNFLSAPETGTFMAFCLALLLYIGCAVPAERAQAPLAASAQHDRRGSGIPGGPKEAAP